MTSEPEFVSATDGLRLAFHRNAGAEPMVVFLPGFASDMDGSKAMRLDAFCKARGQGFLRLDYAGHGRSEGKFVDGTIGRWLDDALTIIDSAGAARVVLAGSSMGGWIALLAALARPDLVAGLLLLAPAPDFTEALMWDALAPPERDALMRDGILTTPSEYGPPLVITRTLIEEGRRHLLMNGPIRLNVPVRLLHGQADMDVPWKCSLNLSAQLESPDVRLMLIKDASHRLSRPSDLTAIEAMLSELLASGGGDDSSEPLAEGRITPGAP